MDVSRGHTYAHCVSDAREIELVMNSHPAQYKPHKQGTTQTKSPRALRNTRIMWLAAFLVLEGIWLGFGLLLRYGIRPGVTGINRDNAQSWAAMAWDSRGLSSLAVFWQTISTIPILKVIYEIYSAEWWHIREKTDRNIDRVSTLTSGFLDQMKHTLAGGATLNFRIGFIIGLLLLPLHSLAPSAIRPRPYRFPSQSNFPIGLLRANLTQFEDNNADPLATQSSQAQISLSKANELAQKVVRFEYVIQVEHSVPDFDISFDQGYILFGMPSNLQFSGFRGGLDHIVYQSDAVTYDYSCQWLAPDMVGGPNGSALSFGGDMEGVIDVHAIVSDVDIPKNFGIYPLEIIAGTGVNNGSFAWVIFSLTSQSDIDLTNNAVDLGIFIELSTIPMSDKTVGVNDWLTYLGGDRGDVFANVSTTASVLFCDPYMKLGTAEIYVEDFGFTLSVDHFDEGDLVVHNLDHDEASRMLGRSLNGIPWDTAVITAQNTSSRLSRLAAELLFQPPQSENFESSTFSTWAPQDLQNISESLNQYTTIAGMNAYLDGSDDAIEVEATSVHVVEVLSIHGPKWITSTSLVVVISILVLWFTIRDFSRKEGIVPFNLEGIHRVYMPVSQRIEERNLGPVSML